MTVAELQAFLSGQPPEAEVVTSSSNPEHRGAWAEARVRVTRAQKTQQLCVDMMDGGRYYAEVFKEHVGGPEVVVVY